MFANVHALECGEPIPVSAATMRKVFTFVAKHDGMDGFRTHLMQGQTQQLVNDLKKALQQEVECVRLDRDAADLPFPTFCGAVDANQTCPIAQGVEHRLRV